MTRLMEGSAACKHLQQTYLPAYLRTRSANLRDKGGMSYVSVIIPTRVPSNPVATYTTSFSLETRFSMESGTPICTNINLPGKFTLFYLERTGVMVFMLFLMDGGTLFS